MTIVDEDEDELEDELLPPCQSNIDILKSVAM
jgi:hypothetical protein